MNAPTRFDREGDRGAHSLETPAPDVAGRHRQDGWTPARQHTFLTALAEGHTVEQCCRFVGLTVSSAYALRRRASGAAFALGWQAAALLARDLIADTLAARAIDGQVETITRPDGGEITRHRYDNRLAMAMLSRLDRLAATDDGERTHQAARLVASDWEAYLAGIERGGGPARAGLFLGSRLGAAGNAALHGADIDPLVALARADRFARTGAATLAELDVADLDPARRAGWSGADWARAEAAGLVVLAPPPPAPAVSAPAEASPGDDGNPPLPPLPPRRDDASGPVWWCDERAAWMTWFPFDEDGPWPEHEEGVPGDEDYERSLTPPEVAALEAARAALLDDPAPDPHAEREAWFAGLCAAVAAAEGGEGEGGSNGPPAPAPTPAGHPQRSADTWGNEPPAPASTPAEAGAQSGDAPDDADRSITSAISPGPRPSPGWGMLVPEDGDGSDRGGAGASDDGGDVSIASPAPAEASGQMSRAMAMTAIERPSQAPTPAQAGAQLGDAHDDADRFITSAIPSGPRPSPGWEGGVGGR